VSDQAVVTFDDYAQALGHAVVENAVLRRELARRINNDDEQDREAGDERTEEA